MTKTQFQTKAQQMFLKANPGAQIVKWTFGPNAVTWKDGTKGYAGQFYAQGDGYRARSVMADYHNGGTWVR